MSEKMLWYRETAAVELADNKKRNWDAEQWGWYMLLKLACWNNEPKGKLTNEEQHLMDMAKANPSSPDFQRRWKQVLACFAVDGEYIVHLKLTDDLKDQKILNREKSRAGKIGQAERRLKELPKNSPHRLALEAELEKLRRTEDADPSSTIPKSKPSDKDKVLYQGNLVYPSLLKKILAEAEGQLADLKKQRSSVKDRKSAFSLNITNNSRLLSGKIQEIKAVLGYIILPTPPPVESPKIQAPLPLPASPSDELSNKLDHLFLVTRERIANHLITPDKLTERILEIEDALDGWQNPPAEFRNHYYAGKKMRPHILEKFQRWSTELEVLQQKLKEKNESEQQSPASRKRRLNATTAVNT